jgi:KAP family P-loop domain
VLDVPRFSLVLALEVEVVSSVLNVYHPGFKTGTDFLEKIIDFPFELPEVTARQRELLLMEEMSTILLCSS